MQVPHAVVNDCNLIHWRVATAVCAYAVITGSY